MSYFIVICTIAFKGTNIMTRNWIQENKPKYVGIVVGDFMWPSLIKEIIDANFR